MRLLLAVLLLSSALLGTQMFLPALPQIAVHFTISDADAQQIIMLYFISFGLSQLFYGPWTDAVGRRKVFYYGQAIFFSGSILCYLADSSQMMALGRILQGLGAGAPLILSRVILSATMSGDKLKKAFGSLAIAASVVAVSAPLLGGFITTTFDWQTAFLVFSGYVVLVSLVGLILLPVDEPKAQRLSLKTMLRDYASLLTDSRFLTAAAFKWWLSLLFLSSGTFLPFALQQGFGLSAEQYGQYMMLPALGLIVGSSLARYLQRYFSSLALIALFWPLIVLCGAILLFYPPSLTTILVAYSLFMVASGGYYPSALQLAIEPFKEKSGTASALVGSIDMFVFSMLAALVNRYWVTDMQSLGALFIVCAVIVAVNALILYFRSATKLCLIDKLGN